MSDSVSNVAIDMLIIGYGSLLCGDDGAGQILTDEIDHLQLPGVVCKAVHQLTPDLAGCVSRAAEVIFIDAYPATPLLDHLRIIELKQSPFPIRRPDHDLATHHCSPQLLMELCDTLYHTQPIASLVGIPGHDFSIGESISPTTRLAMNEAKLWFTERLHLHA